MRKKVVYLTVVCTLLCSCGVLQPVDMGLWVTQDESDKLPEKIEEGSIEEDMYEATLKDLYRQNESGE